jgi:hypothetical protein
MFWTTQAERGVGGGEREALRGQADCGEGCALLLIFNRMSVHKCCGAFFQFLVACGHETPRRVGVRLGESTLIRQTTQTTQLCVDHGERRYASSNQRLSCSIFKMFFSVWPLSLGHIANIIAKANSFSKTHQFSLRTTVFLFQFCVVSARSPVLST